MKALRLSMERFGYLTPIVVDQNNLIADGEHRALIYKEFGLEEIPAYRVTFSDDAERRLLRQTMNKLRGQHDFAMDADEMALIYESSKLPDLSALIAQNEATLKDLMLKYKPGLPFGHEDDEQLDQIIDEQLKRVAPDSQLGDIYQLGNHRLICADCTDKRSIDQLMEGKQADMIFTDPPYNMMGSSHGFVKLEDDNMIRPFFRDIAYTIKNTLKQDGHAYICCNWRSYPTLAQECRTAALVSKNLIVWHKPNMLLGAMYASSHEFIYFIANENVKHLHPHSPERRVRTVTGETNVWTYNMNPGSEENKHMAAKPIELGKRAIENSSDKGNIILDLFLGSGSTLIACEQTGRNCYGVEIDPHYCDVIIKRWENYTNNKAVKL